MSHTVYVCVCVCVVLLLLVYWLGQQQDNVNICKSPLPPSRWNSVPPITPSLPTLPKQKHKAIKWTPLDANDKNEEELIKGVSSLWKYYTLTLSW